MARVTTITGPKCAIVGLAGTERVGSSSGARVPSASSSAERRSASCSARPRHPRLAGVNSGPLRVGADHPGGHGVRSMRFASASTIGGPASSSS